MSIRVTFLFLLLTVCATGPAAAQLRLHGSNTVGEELAPALVRAWLEQRGYRRIEVRPLADLERRIIGTNDAGESLWVEIHAHGSSTSFRGLASGDADMGMSSRRVRPAEVEQLAALGELGDPRHEFVVGIDGLAVIVHPDNPVTALRIDQIRDAFSGRARNWRDLGGADAPITIYARDEKSGTFDSFDSMVMQGAEIAAAANRFESSSLLSDRVAADPNAIGFIGLPYIREARALAVSSGDAAVPPTTFSSATEDYPLSRRLYLYVPETQLNGPGGSLARFAISDAGQTIVDRIGFVGQAIDVRAVAVPEDAPAQYREFVRGALRASMNFRFQPGRPELDSKSARDLERLVAFMKQPENRYSVMLMGFADPSETMKYFSLTLSNDRVDYVAAHLLQAGVPVSRVRGFGDALQLAEGTGNLSQAKNRRVEVWLKPRPGRATSSAGSR